jgi:hypothetical protein
MLELYSKEASKPIRIMASDVGTIFHNIVIVLGNLASTGPVCLSGGLRAREGIIQY